MNTHRKQRARTRFIVQKQVGEVIVDCRLAPPSETGLGPNLTGRRGLLVAAKGSEPTVFPGERSADRAIHKTCETRRILKGSMVDQHPRLQPILEGNGMFKTRTFVQ